MLYLDNAATSLKKPTAVFKAMQHAMINYGANAGRGGHFLSRLAGEKVYETRELLCEYFGIENVERLAFFPNTTYALNAAIFGVLAGGGHAVTTSLEHNSVIRPLAELKRRGKSSYTVAEGDLLGRISPQKIEAAFTPYTRLLIVTGASNVCGNAYDIEALAKLAHSRGAYILVDAAQIAGSREIDAKNFDMLAFPGHKGLLGPQGTGGLYVAPNVTLAPFAVGGTGSMSESIYQPEAMPDYFESGTLNMPAIAGLYESVKFIIKEGTKNIHNYEMELFDVAKEALLNMDNITCYGDFFAKERMAVLSFNVKNVDSVTVANELDERFNIAVRAGLHCAPLAHKTLDTGGGSVRMSFGYFNTKKEVKTAIDAVYRIMKGI